MICRPQFVLSVHAYPGLILGRDGHIVGHGCFIALNVLTYQIWMIFQYGRYYGQIRYTGNKYSNKKAKTMTDH